MSAPRSRRSDEVLPEDGSNPYAQDNIIVDDDNNELLTNRVPVSDETGGRKESLPDMLQTVEHRANPLFMEEANPLGELLIAGKEKYSLDLRTDLTEVQIVQFARARIMADHFKIPELAAWVEHLERLSVSRGRKGRKEFVEAFKAATNGSMPDAQNIGQNMAEKLRS